MRVARTARNRSRRVAGIGTLLALLVMGALGPPAAAGPAARAGENAPAVALLAPHDGAALNVEALQVRALVAAFKPHPSESFFLNGQARTGKNAGRISHVDITVNDVLVERLDVDQCLKQVLVERRIDVSALAEGAHRVTVTAYQGSRRAGLARSASAAFVLDRALPVAEGNRVEELATPTAFACLGLKGSGHQHDDDRGRAGRRQLRLEGTLVLGQPSDGLDPARERVVVALGPHVTVLPPGTLACGDGECEFEDRSHPFIRRIELKVKRDGRVEFALHGPALPADADRLYLRIGNDWGGVDLRTGEFLVDLRAVPDTARRAEALIGPAGGSVETVDATGVGIRLAIPPGALTRDTVIAVTPLLASPLPNASKTLHAGVKLEPEGQVFAAPATLALDFGAAGVALRDDHFVFLLTSPMTALPVRRRVDPVAGTLTATIQHFSVLTGAAPDAAYTELAAWANPILAAAGLATLSEIRSMALLAEVQASLGCTTGCIDLAELSAVALASLNALVTSACAEGKATPSDDAIARLLELEGERAVFGATDVSSLDCIGDILRELIEQARAEAEVDPTDAHLQRLLDLAGDAATLGLDDLETLAFSGLAKGLRALIDDGKDLCETDPDSGRTLLERAQPWMTLASTNLAAVDPTLASDLQAALDSCGLASGVEVLAARLDVSRLASISSGLRCTQTKSTLGGDAEATFPLTLLAECPTASLQLELTKLGDTGFTVDAVGSAREAASNFTGFAGFAMTVDGPGTIEVRLESSWLTKLEPSALFSARVQVGCPDAAVGFASITNLSGTETLRPTLDLEVPAAGRCNISVSVSASQLQQRFGRPAPEITGTGRLATVRFVADE